MKPRALNKADYKIVNGDWPFVLRSPLTVFLGLGHHGKHEFLYKGNQIGTLIDDVLTINAGYASDGASPHAFNIFGFRIGAPSHERIAEAFFTHDFLYQFGSLKQCPWTYDKADQVLYDLMQQKGSILAAPYYAIVSRVGSFYRRLTKLSSDDDDVSCIIH